MVLHRENCSQFFPKRKKMKPKSLMLRLCVYLFLYSSAFLAQFYVAAVVQDFCSSTLCAFKILYASCIILFLFFALYVIMQEFYYQDCVTCLFRLSNLCIPALTENTFSGEKSPSSRLAFILKNQNSSFVKKAPDQCTRQLKSGIQRKYIYFFSHQKAVDLK